MTNLMELNAFRTYPVHEPVKHYDANGEEIYVYRLNKDFMNALFIADIAFTPLNEGDKIPSELRAHILNDEGLLDTRQARSLVRTMPRISSPFWSCSKDKEWAQENYFGEGGARFDIDDESLLQLRMITRGRVLSEWIEVLSLAFPNVRVAVRGEKEGQSITSHFVIVAGQYIHLESELDKNVANLNLRARIFPDRAFTGWAGRMLDYSASDDVARTHSNVRNVLRDEATSKELLWAMNESLKLTPKQSKLLVAHPNYRKRRPDVDYWRKGANRMVLSVGMSIGDNTDKMDKDLTTATVEIIRRVAKHGLEEGDDMKFAYDAVTISSRLVEVVDAWHEIPADSPMLKIASDEMSNLIETMFRSCFYHQVDLDELLLLINNYCVIAERRGKDASWTDDITERITSALESPCE